MQSILSMTTIVSNQSCHIRVVEASSAARAVVVFVVILHEEVEVDGLELDRSLLLRAQVCLIIFFHELVLRFPQDDGLRQHFLVLVYVLQVLIKDDVGSVFQTVI